MVDQPNLRFTFEDQEYTWDWKMTIKDAIFLKDKAHVSGADLFAYLDRRDPETVAAFVMLTKRKLGEAVRWEDMLTSNIFSFNWLPVEDENDDAPTEATGGDAGEDPTSHGKTPKGGTSKTAKP